MPFAMVTAVAIGIMALTVARMYAQLTRQNVYFSAMNKTYQLAEAGLDGATSILAYDPNVDSFNANHSNPVVVASLNGEYRNRVFMRNDPVENIYYIITSATRTVQGRSYSTRLHSYARVSNVAEYFAAIKDDLVISHPVNIGQGKIYASTLTFLYDWNMANQTRLGYASYVFSVDPSNWSQQHPGGFNYYIKDEIVISSPTIAEDPIHPNEPVQLTTPLLFPDLLEEDFSNYRDKAGQHTQISNIVWSDIFPPGYVTSDGNPDPLDGYPLHRNVTNREHVYYSTGSMRVGGIIHGQVLFVSERDIYIASNVISSLSPNYPGQGSPSQYESSSTAHQAVFIARGNIIIEAFPFISTNTVTIQTVTIQGLFLAPHGRIIPQGYVDGETVLVANGNTMSRHEALSLNFSGSMILSNLRSTPSFYDVFGKNRPGARVYTYMNSLRTNPPPYLPALTELHYSLEEVTGTTGL